MLAGRSVRIVGLPGPLEPNAETRKRRPGDGPLELNGQCCRCLWWDEAESKYAVLTFDGVVAGVPAEGLEELLPELPDAGGFDASWGAPLEAGSSPSAPSAAWGAAAAAQVAADSAAEALAARGYAVVQTFAGPALRAAAVEEAAAATTSRERPAFDEARAETEAAYLGDGPPTRCAVLEVDDTSKPPEDALAYLNRSLTEIASVIADVAPSHLGFSPGDRSAALVRTTADGQDPPEASRELQDEDLGDMYVENFLSWVFRRKICMIYVVQASGGSLELRPKGGAAEGAKAVRLPLRQNRIMLFRHDVFSYAYRPEGGETLALQEWLQEEGENFEFREIDRAPEVRVEDSVHVVSIHELFPANCDGGDMTFRAFIAGTDALTGVPISRFDEDLYCIYGDPLAPAVGKAYTMHGALIDNDRLVGFDSAFFGVSDEEAMAMAPAQRWVLETGYATLYNGGLTKKSLSGKRVGTFLGDSGSEWNGFTVGMVYGLYQRRDQYQASCNTCYTTVSRLAHCLNLTGPCLTVDTACSASLVAANSAMHMMRRHILRDGEERRVQEVSRESLRHAVCGGILAMVHPGGWIGECGAKMLSLRGRCFTWDASADGFIRGEGCCCAYLRSQDDPDVEEAERHLAVIMGSAVTANGRGASLTAPSGPAQSAALHKSLREGGMQPGDVVIGECHGTATPLGDPIEIGACKTVMKGKRDLFPIMHSTAKAHVGHEEANAGACALIKAVLMANGSVSTPNPGLVSLNGNIDVEGYPVQFVNELTPTTLGEQIVGVSSFGFGGSIAVCHVWADAEVGAFKDGRRIQLDRDEALQWIDRAIRNAGSQRQLDGVCLGHKQGH